MDANAWLREYQQQAQERLDRAEEIREQVRESTATVQSPDGAVRLTVGPTGALTNLELTARAGQLSQTQLAQVILRTAQEAHRQVAQRMAQAVKPLIGDSEAMEFLERFVPPADPGTATAQPGGGSAGGGDDDFHSGSVLR